MPSRGPSLPLCSSVSSEASGLAADEGSSSDSSLDDVTLSVLSGSRSTLRREAKTQIAVNRAAEIRIGPYDAPQPRYLPRDPPVIDLDLDHHSESESEGSEKSQGGVSTTSSRRLRYNYSRPIRRGQVSKSSRRSTNSPDSDIGSLGNEVSSVPNTLLPPSACRALASVRERRCLWIPTYRQSARRDPNKIAPWSEARIARICIRTLDLDLLFRHFSKPKNFLFPLAPRGRASRSGEWASGLITVRNTERLYDQAPWDILNVPVIPLSFPMSGWYAEMDQMYHSLEHSHLQAIGESTHTFSISLKLRQKDRQLMTFWRQRKQRRSRFGARWKAFLKFLLSGMVAGYCDLDILLDPFFLHYPRLHVVSWSGQISRS